MENESEERKKYIYSTTINQNIYFHFTREIIYRSIQYILCIRKELNATPAHTEKILCVYILHSLMEIDSMVFARLLLIECAQES